MNIGIWFETTQRGRAQGERLGAAWGRAIARTPGGRLLQLQGATQPVPAVLQARLE